MNQIYSIKYRILIVLIVSIVPLHALCADYFTVNGINYQVISSSAKTVRVGWHITNGTSVSYQNSPTALSNTSMTGSVEIPSVVGGYTVVEVDSHAFSGTKLTSIVLPSSVKTIKSSAFGSTSSLKEIFIPNSVTKIEGSAFSGCSGLYEIYIPESITALNGSTFRNCKNLTIVHFSESLEKLGTYDFYGCTSLKSIVFPTSLKSFYGYNFESTGFQQLDLPNSLTWIGSDFKNCSQLVSLIMGENIATGDAFRECEKLKHIWVKNTNPSSCSKSFVNIASGARLYVPVGTKSKYASLEGWNNIPNIAEVIGDVLFILSNSDEVTEYMVTNREKKEVQIGTNSFAAISDEKTTYEIPPTITNTSGEVFNVVGIGNNAFLGCANLESLRIPQNILKISSAFNGCVKLRSIYFDSRNPSDIEFESNCFDELPSDACFYVPAGTKSRYEALGVIKNSSQIVEVSPLSIGDVATVLGSQANMPIILNSAEVISGIQCKLTLPEGVSLVEEEGEPVVSLTNRTEGFTVMGHKDPDAENSYLFVMFSLEGNPIIGNKGTIMNVKLNVPKDVTLGKYDMTIEDISLATSTFNTLYPAAASSELLIESNVRNIDFADANVKAICVSNWDVNHDGELDTDEAASVTNLNNAFKGNTNITSFDELQYFTGLTSIPSCAFYGCKNLSTITIPDNVKSIEDQVFSHCESLTSVIIPNSVTSIGDWVFDYCSGLTSVSIGSGVSSIGIGIFNNCSSLTSINVDSNNLKYDSRDNCNAIIETESNTLFRGCKGTIIPNSVTSIARYGFEYSYGLTSINIPNSITSIGSSAFNGCRDLTSVTIGSMTPLAIEIRTFSNRSNATLYVPEGCAETYKAANYWKEFKDIREFSENGFIISANEIFKGTNLWAGYVSQEDLALPDELEAYIITDLGTTTATAYPIDYIPESEPVLLKRENTTIGSFEMLPGTGTAPTMNLLKTYTTDKIVSNREGFVLYNDEFVLVNEGTLPAGCVFLPANSTVVALTRSIIINGDDATEIENTKVDNDVPKDQWYDFQGRKLERKPVKSGIYILNGRKVVVKY